MTSSAQSRRRLALVVDPRFPGGTSTAVAQEIRTLDGHVDLRVFAIETTMFRDRRINAALEAALEACGLELIWNPPVIRSEIVFFHNPSFLRFDERLDLRVSCGLALLIAHENFLRPNGSEGLDVEKCLRLIDASLVCRSRFIAPISAYNRRTVEDWVPGSRSRLAGGRLRLLQRLRFPLRPADRERPRDRRGRHSRPGFEKFPPLETMLKRFPGARRALPDPRRRHPSARPRTLPRALGGAALRRGGRRRTFSPASTSSSTSPTRSGARASGG